MLHQIFRWIRRTYYGYPHSRLQTLLDERGDACHIIALNIFNRALCANQETKYKITGDIGSAAEACFHCPIQRDYEGHKLDILVRELESTK